MVAVPLDGLMSPVNILNVVVLPAPKIEVMNDKAQMLSVSTIYSQ